MNSKMLSVAGLVATLVCSQAFAASPQLQQLSRTQVGARIMQELGVSTATADLSAALTAKYGAAEAGSILAAINQFNGQVASSKDANVLATSIFRLDNQGHVNVAAMSTSSRTGMVQPIQVRQGDVCSVDQFASDLARDTRVSYATARAVVDAKIVSMGSCKGGVTNFNRDARENLLQMAEYALNNGGAKLSGAELDLVLAAGLAQAKNDDAGAVPTTAKAELATIASLRGNCHLIR